MKRILFLCLFCFAYVFTGCSKEVSVQPSDNKVPQDPVNVSTKPLTPTAAPTPEPVQKYKDGTYEVTTEPDMEGYYIKAKVIIEKGEITTADWTIYDSIHEDKPFDENYKEIFKDNPIYYDQAIKDWENSRGYSDELIETQDLGEVDAVSGATWACNQFKKAVTDALDQAAGGK